MGYCKLVLIFTQQIILLASKGCDFMEEKTVLDWKENFRKESKENQDLKPKLKILDGESHNITFLDEGVRIKSAKYGDAVLFNVLENSIEKVWFVSVNKWSMLKEIARNDPLAGKAANIMRIGKDKDNTRYSIKFV